MSTAKKPVTKSTEDLQATLQSLIAQGRKDGMIRAADLHTQLEKLDLSPEKIEEIYDRFEAMNIQIVSGELDLDLDDDLDLRVAHITANGTYAVCVKGMRALTREMTVLIAVNASVPVVCTVPIPCRGGSDAVTGLSGLGIAMLLGKMLVPIHIFYADPFAAVTSGEVGNVLTANEAEIAVVT